MKKLLAIFSVLFLLGATFVLCLAASAIGQEAAPAATPSPADELWSFIVSLIPASWEGWITSIVTLCAAVSAVWPRPADNAPKPLRLLYALINLLAINAWRAKNASAVCKRS